MKDLYQILGVSENADDGTIKKAFRKLAKQNHPDATGGDKRKAERFKEVNEAYSILGDKQKRAEYDRLKHAPMGADGMPQGFDPDTFADVFGGQGGQFRGGRTRSGVNVEFGGDLNDLFSSLFGGGGGGGGGGFNRFSRAGGGTAGARQRARGPDLVGELEVSLREAALGTRRTVTTGSGASVEVQIPSGVDTGGRLRIPGQGGPSPRAGGQPGDLHLEIRVAPDPLFRRNGQDLEIAVPLKLTEACLGAKVNVPTIEGSVTVTIPPGTSSGARLRLRGKGIKRPDGSRGDQICRVEITVPKIAPDDEESRRLLEEFERRTQPGPVRNF